MVPIVPGATAEQGLRRCEFAALTAQSVPTVGMLCTKKVTKSKCDVCYGGVENPYFSPIEMRWRVLCHSNNVDPNPIK